MENLRATSEETEVAQKEMTNAFVSGTTNVKQLASIFGASLGPALDIVAKQTGATKEKLEALINSGKLGSDVVLPALAGAAKESTSGLNVMAQATQFSHSEIQKLVESAKIAGNEVIPGMATALGKSAEQMTETDKSINNLSTSWNFFLKQIGDLLTQKGALSDFWDTVKTKWNTFFQEQDKNWDKFKAGTINSLSEIGLGLGVLVTDVKEGFNVIGGTIGTTLAAIANWNFSDLGDSLDQMLQKSANSITEFTNKANDMVKRLWEGKTGADNSKESMDNLGEAIKNIPLVKFSDELEESFKKINNTTEASDALNVIWKELKTADPFSGKDASTLLLAASIKKVQDNTGDAQGTLDAFGKKLAELPSEQLLKVLDTSQKLSGQLKTVGDSGQLAQVITSAAFQKLGLDASSLSDGYSNLSKDTTQAFAVIATNATSTGEQVRAAFGKAINAVETQKDLQLLTEVFDNLAKSGKLAAEEISLAYAEIGDKQVELSNKNNVVSDSFKLLGVTSSRELEKMATSAKAAFGVVETGSAIVKNIEKSFLAWAEAEIKAAQAAERPIDPLLQQKAASLGLADALDHLIREHQRLSPELEGLVAKSERVSNVFYDQIDRFDQSTAAQRRQIQASIDLARVKGDEYTAIAKTIELSKFDVDKAKEKAALTDILIHQLDVQVNAIYAAANADGVYNAAEQKVVDQLINTITLLKEKNATLKGQIPIIEETSKRTIAGALSSSSANSQFGDSQRVVNRELKEGEKTADGYTKTQGTLVKHTNDGKAALQGLSSYLKQTRDLMDSLSEKTRQLFEVELMKALSDHGVKGAYKGYRDAIAAFNNDTTESGKRVSAFSKELFNANALIKQSEEKILHASNGFRLWEAAIELAAGKAKKAFYEQAVQAEYLQQQVENLANDGMRNLNLATTQLATFAQQANTGFSLLDQEDLSNLRGALDDANQKLEQMRQEAAAVTEELARLDEEIAREKGDTDLADKLALENEQRQRMIELENKLATAKAQNQTDLVKLYDEEISKLRELYNLKESNLDQTIRQRNEEEKINKTTGGSSKPSGSGSGSSGTTHTLQLKGPDGTTATTQVPDEETVNKVLDILKKSGMRLA